MQQLRPARLLARWRCRCRRRANSRRQARVRPVLCNAHSLARQPLASTSLGHLCTSLHRTRRSFARFSVTAHQRPSTTLSEDGPCARPDLDPVIGRRRVSRTLRSFSLPDGADQLPPGPRVSPCCSDCIRRRRRRRRRRRKSRGRVAATSRGHRHRLLCRRAGAGAKRERVAEGKGHLDGWLGQPLSCKPGWSSSLAVARHPVSRARPNHRLQPSVLARTTRRPCTRTLTTPIPLRLAQRRPSGDATPHRPPPLLLDAWLPCPLRPDRPERDRLADRTRAALGRVWPLLTGASAGLPLALPRPGQCHLPPVDAHHRRLCRG